MRCLWVAEHDDKGTPFRLTEHQILKHALAKLHEFIGHQAPDASGITARVRLGNPTEQIVAEAREWQADLVVLGTHGRSGLPRLLLGSIAEATLRDAGCSALVIPNQGLTVTRPRPTAAEEYATV
jgi:nucleotide-binding universal stress UspA family protein